MGRYYFPGGRVILLISLIGLDFKKNNYNEIIFFGFKDIRQKNRTAESQAVTRDVGGGDRKAEK